MPFRFLRRQAGLRLVCLLAMIAGVVSARAETADRDWRRSYNGQPTSDQQPAPDQAFGRDWRRSYNGQPTSDQQPAPDQAFGRDWRRSYNGQPTSNQQRAPDQAFGRDWRRSYNGQPTPDQQPAPDQHLVGATPVATQPGTAPDENAVGATPVATPFGTAPATSTLDEITVTATLRRDTTVRRLPASIAVLDQATLESAAVQHFEELVALVPNLNWSGEGSRARYFQVRGSGELEQYEGAPNASVGFIIDDIDFSDIGGIATTFDMDRVEVLRGPQGTRYGANALAGLVYAQSAPPPEVAEVRTEALAGSDGTRGVGLAAGGPVPGTAESLAYRLAFQQYASDGFQRNADLGRDDTDERDELTARGKLRWRPAPGWQADLTGLYVDLDNGYDAWTLDNSFTTRADQPGQDTQRTTAGSLRVTGPVGAAADLVSITGVADSDILYSFDSDWGNAALWAPDVYAFSQRTDRARRTFNQELRLVSTPAGRLGGRLDWLAGLYALRLSEDNRIHDLGLLDLDDSACPPPADPGFCEPFAVDKTVSSDYTANSLALFGELGLALGARTRLSLGLRGERRAADYSDHLDDRLTPATAQNRFEPTDRMWGGDLALQSDLARQVSAYARIARGYKAGGFNPEPGARGFRRDRAQGVAGAGTVRARGPVELRGRPAFHRCTVLGEWQRVLAGARRHAGAGADPGARGRSEHVRVRHRQCRVSLRPGPGGATRLAAERNADAARGAGAAGYRAGAFRE